MRRNLLLVTLALLCLTAPTSADEKPAIDVTGDWTFIQSRPDGQAVTVTVSLKQSGQVVTGTYHGQGPDTEIYDGSLSGNELKFATKREIDGRHVTLTYRGIVEGDTVTGEVDGHVGWHDRKQPWKAQRTKS